MRNDSFKNFHTLLGFAEKIISLRPRTEKEIKSKLVLFSNKRNISPTTIDEVIKKLKEIDLINDKNFVEWWINQRDYFKPKGKIALKTELLAKGIDGEAIENILSEKKHSRKSDLDLAVSALGKKIEKYKKIPQEERKGKISSYLLRRGFDFDTIESAIDSLEKKFYNTNSKNH